MKRYILIIVLSFSILLSCSALETIKVTAPNGEVLYLEVADTPELREKGLMFRKEMDMDHGMIFVFGEMSVKNFWMKNTFIPLSIAYLDSNGVVRHIANMEPESLESVSSIYPARFAIELNQGAFEKLDIHRGTKLELPEDILHEVK